MRRFKIVKPTLIGVVLALVSTSCALFAVPNDVGVKNLTVDLTFGGNQPPTNEPLPDFSLPPVPVIELPEPPPPIPPPPPPPPICPPPPSTAAPRDPAVPTINPHNVPQLGEYMSRSQGNYENEEPFIRISTKDVTNLVQQGDGFRFSVKDTVTQMRLTLEAQPINEDDPANRPGLYLVRMELPAERPQIGGLDPRALAFEPAEPLQLTPFPIQPGTDTTDAAPDVAPKNETPIQDPITGAPLLSPSLNSMASTMIVDSAETIVVCSSLAQAYRASWDLEITGEFNIRILGTFWLATQYGGWPIKDDFVVVGDLLPGNFSSSLMRIDPTDTI